MLVRLLRVIERLFVGLFVLLVTVIPASAQSIAGDWQGTLAIGGVDLRLVVHLTPDSKGGYTATLDSPDQGATGLPVTSVTRKGSMLQLELKQILGGFSGTIDAGLATINGTWTQAGNSLPLVLKRVAR
jgi:uncharacterized protein